MSAPRCVYSGCTGRPASPELGNKFCDEVCAAQYGLQAADALELCPACNEWTDGEGCACPVDADDECEWCGEVCLLPARCDCREVVAC